LEGGERLNKKGLLIAVVLMAAAMLAAPNFSILQPVAAQETYQQITGKLGGAEYLLRIPDNWEGALVVMCRGYSPTPVDLAGLEFYADMFSTITTNGAALAMSTFGEAGWCVQKGMIRTHQLTEYIIDHYDVTGTILLFGMSMGGGIALLLGTKYPHLYDGVIEIAGVKDVAAQYTLTMNLANIMDDDELAEAILANGGSVPPCPLAYGYDIPTALAGYRAFCLTSSTDIALELGGTPETKPKAYERVSPIFNAVDIAVPTITVHGCADSVVSYAQSLAYLEAVTQAGYSDLYRLYGVPGGEHIDDSMAMGMQIYFGITWLVDWVENGNPAPPSMPEW
jgi:pimeloyl-ACP methyl ester carboxylesterase